MIDNSINVKIYLKLVVYHDVGDIVEAARVIGFDIIRDDIK
jgi:hypothetical protein